MAASTLSSEPSQEVFPWLKLLPLAPEYRPTLAEFQDPIAYIFKIEKEASKYGICKIVPPVPPASKKATISNLNRSLAAREVAQDGGACNGPRFTTRQQQIGFCPRRPRPVQRPVWQSGEYYTFQEFEAKAKSFEKNYLKKRGKKSHLSALEIETLYWKATVDKPFCVEYANDMPGSAFIPLRAAAAKKRESGDGGTVGETAWNMRRVSRAEGSLLRFMKEEIPGVTSPMVYVAMMFSWFAWHVEDHDLHSLNYLHMGAGKTWYGVPREAAVAFEEVVRVHGYGGELNPLVTFATLGEKTTVMSPEVFIKDGIPCCRLVQNPGEFVVTFPRAYHSGFSHGFNCGEAANIATPEWLKMAKDASIRRAAINYPPMVSHYQLLYDLALALCSRVPSGLNTKPRSSRLKDKKRSEGEKLIKELFVQNVIQNNKLLYSLGKGSSVVLLPRSSSDVSVCSDLRVGSHLRTNQKISHGLLGNEDAMKDEDLDSDNNMMGIIDGTKPMKSFVSVREKFTSLCERNRNHPSSGNKNQATVDNETESSVQAEGLSDQRLFSCVTCGILSFDCVAIVQPKKAAARYLMSADCSFFNDWTVSYGINSTRLTVAGLDSRASELKPQSKRTQKNPDYLHDVPVQTVNYHMKTTDRSDEVASDRKSQKDSNALGLLASAYGDSSDSDKDHDFSDVPFLERKTNITDCSAERNYQQDGTHVDEASPQVINCNEVPGLGRNVVELRNDRAFEGSIEFITEKFACRRVNSLEASNAATSCSTLSCAAEPKKLGTGNALKSNIDMPFVTTSDEDSSRMHVFCLEHAVEVEKQLKPIGGAHIMLLCHPEYPRIEAEAKLEAEELGFDHHWNEIEFQNATQEDEHRIQSALDSGETMPGNGDWSVKLGVNLFYSAILSRSPLYSKQMPYNSVMYNVFGRSTPVSSPSEPGAPWKKCARQKKFVAGKWCGKVWMSNQVHPFLAQQDSEEEEQERNFASQSILDESVIEEKPIIRRNKTTLVTRKYSRKRRKSRAGTLSNDKVKYFETEDGVSDDDTSEERSYKQHWKDSGIDGDSCFEGEDAVSGDSSYQIPDQRIRSVSRRRRSRFVENEDEVVLDGVLVSLISYPKCRGTFREKRVKVIQSDNEASDRSLEEEYVSRDYAVSDDSMKFGSKNYKAKRSKLVERDEAVTNDYAQDDDNSHDGGMRIHRSKRAKTITDMVLYDSEENDYCRPKKEIRKRNQSRCSECRNDFSNYPPEDSPYQQNRRIIRKKRVKNVEEEEDAEYDYFPEEDSSTKHKRTAKNRLVRTTVLRKVKPESPQLMKEAQGFVVKKPNSKKKKQETPRFSNVKQEEHSRRLDSCVKGHSTRLRTRTPKLTKELETKPRQTGKKTKNASASRIVSREEAEEEEEEKEEEEEEEEEEESSLEYPCDIEGCTMSFSTKQQLVLHKRNICPVKGCGKKFFSHKYLVQHRRVHLDDRPLKCPWKGCKMTFKWAWARTEHIRVHTGARPYVCAEPGCGQTFRFVSDFSRHKRKTGHTVKKTKR